MSTDTAIEIGIEGAGEGATTTADTIAGIGMTDTATVVIGTVTIVDIMAIAIIPALTNIPIIPTITILTTITTGTPRIMEESSADLYGAKLM
jgi:hypothetical protein